MSPESMAFKQKKRVKNAPNKYLKPGALAKLCYRKTTTRSCTDIGKKRVVLESKKLEVNLLHPAGVVVHSSTPIASPSRPDFQFVEDDIKKQKLLGTPKTPHSAVYDSQSRLESLPMDVLFVEDDIKKQRLLSTPKTPHSAEYDSQSRLESLPMDVLVKVLCHLHHDQLRAVFHVSQRVRTAVLLARQCHFNFTTPDRSRQEMLMTKTPLPTEHWPFISKGEGKCAHVSIPQTPKAPRHGPRPPRFPLDTTQISAVLFPEVTWPPKSIVPPGLPKSSAKLAASNRVLFYEEELCQAVAQNKLR